MNRLFLIACCFFCLVSQAQKKYVVDANGSGDFKTVQAALNAVPLNNKKPVTIFIKAGTYYEKLQLDSSKDHVTLEGEDKFNCILTYNDHTGKLSPAGDTINTRTSWSFRCLANDLTARNIHFRNDAGFNAGQAVAVESDGDRASFINCRFTGFQDVLFTNSEKSRQYFEDCYIEGTTDFIFGAATAWFERCHIHSKKDSHVTAASTPKENEYGYIFNDCVLTGDSSIHKATLGRPWRPYAMVVYLNCYIGQHIRPEGFSNWNNTDNYKFARYAEFGSYGPGADSSRRLNWVKQLTAQEAKQFSIKKCLGKWISLHPR